MSPIEIETSISSSFSLPQLLTFCYVRYALRDSLVVISCGCFSGIRLIKAHYTINYTLIVFAIQLNSGRFTPFFQHSFIRYFPPLFFVVKLIYSSCLSAFVAIFCPHKQKSAGKNLRASKKIKNFSRLTTTSYEYRTFFS